MGGVYEIMQDLTIIFITANQTPEKFAQYQWDILMKAIKDYPLIMVSREIITANERIGPLIYDTGPKCHANMYYQLLQAAKLAKTPYIAMAEDDVLYPEEHFREFRPPMDSVSYDMSRWSLYTWVPLFSLKQRVSNCSLIAPREYLIEALEERFARYSVEDFPPQLVSEVGRYEENLRISKRNMVKWYASKPLVHINHPNGTDSLKFRKRLGEIKAVEIPDWGRAEDIIKLYV